MFANAEQSASNIKNTDPLVLKNLLSYKPPAQIQNGGMPEKRVNGGGTRGSAQIASFQFLAPAHTALTSQAEPTIYWYVSNPEVKNVTLNILQGERLVAEKTFSIASSGLQQLNFKELGISLQPNSEYLISLENSNQGNENFSNVTVMYKPESSSLKNLEDKAQAGYWYDVFPQLVASHAPETNELLKQIDINIPALP